MILVGFIQIVLILLLEKILLKENCYGNIAKNLNISYVNANGQFLKLLHSKMLSILLLFKALQWIKNSFHLHLKSYNLNNYTYLLWGDMFLEKLSTNKIKFKKEKVKYILPERWGSNIICYVCQENPEEGDIEESNHAKTSEELQFDAVCSKSKKNYETSTLGIAFDTSNQKIDDSDVLSHVSQDTCRKVTKLQSEEKSEYCKPSNLEDSTAKSEICENSAKMLEIPKYTETLGYTQSCDITNMTRISTLNNEKNIQARNINAQYSQTSEAEVMEYENYGACSQILRTVNETCNIDAEKFVIDPASIFQNEAKCDENKSKELYLQEVSTEHSLLGINPISTNMYGNVLPISLNSFSEEANWSGLGISALDFYNDPAQEHSFNKFMGYIKAYANTYDGMEEEMEIDHGSNKTFDFPECSMMYNESNMYENTSLEKSDVSDKANLPSKAIKNTQEKRHVKMLDNTPVNETFMNTSEYHNTTKEYAFDCSLRRNNSPVGLDLYETNSALNSVKEYETFLNDENLAMVNLLETLHVTQANNLALQNELENNLNVLQSLKEENQPTASQIWSPSSIPSEFMAASLLTVPAGPLSADTSVKDTDVKRVCPDSNTFGMYEIGESSKEILDCDPNYKPYPGLVEDPSKVKKDAKYQKKFYKLQTRYPMIGSCAKKKTHNQPTNKLQTANPSLSQKVKTQYIKEDKRSLESNPPRWNLDEKETKSRKGDNFKVNEKKICSTSTDDSLKGKRGRMVAERLKQNESHPELKDFNAEISSRVGFVCKNLKGKRGKMAEERRKQKESHPDDSSALNIGVLKDFNAETSSCVSIACESSFMYESPESSDCHDDSDSKTAPTVESADSMSKIRKVKGSSEFHEESKNKESSTVEIAGLKSKARNAKERYRNEIENSYYLQICFNHEGFNTKKSTINVRDRFYELPPKFESQNVTIPLIPMFIVEDTRYVNTGEDQCIEEYLISLYDLQNIYYEMKFFDDPAIYTYRSLIKHCRIPMKHLCENDDDYELVGDNLMLGPFTQEQQNQCSTPDGILQKENNQVSGAILCDSNNFHEDTNVALDLVLQNYLLNCAQQNMLINKNAKNSENGKQDRSIVNQREEDTPCTLKKCKRSYNEDSIGSNSLEEMKTDSNESHRSDESKKPKMECFNSFESGRVENEPKSSNLENVRLEKNSIDYDKRIKYLELMGYVE